MPTSHVFRDKKHNRTVIHIPSFLRDKFNLQNRDEVEIDTDGTSIIITPKKKEGGKESTTHELKTRGLAEK